MANDLQVRNKMTAEALKQSENSRIDFVGNPKKDGNIFFSCGSKTGYVGQALKGAIAEGTVDVTKVMYAETSKDGKEWVPCLFLPNTQNVILSI